MASYTHSPYIFSLSTHISSHIFCVAVRCSALQRVAVLCLSLHPHLYVAVCCSVLQCVAVYCSHILWLHRVSLLFRNCALLRVCCSVLQRVAACCRVLQGVAGCCRVLQSVAVCCRVSQSAAECCNVSQGRDSCNVLSAKFRLHGDAVWCRVKDISRIYLWELQCGVERLHLHISY